jgi:hypothetical protein
MKITDQYKIDSISIPKSRWISLKSKVESIGKGKRNTVISPVMIGFYFGLFIMAAFGTIYSRSRAETVTLPAVDVQPVFDIYLLVTLAVALGILNWFALIYWYQEPIRNLQKEIVSEMDDLDRKRAVQEESK